MLRQSLFLCLVGALASFLLPGAVTRADVFGVPVSATASSEFNANFGVVNLFDGTVTNSDIGATSYGQGDAQWAGQGVGPFNVFMDYGTELTGVDGLVYSQRLGGNPALDKVGRIDLWFSNTDFGGVIPATPANASVPITNTTNSLLTQYTFAGSDFSGQFVAARFIAPVGGGGNIGGSEFRLTFNTPIYTNPTFLVDRDTGNILLTNETPEPFTFIAYELESPNVGALDASAWTSIADNYDANYPWTKFTPAPFIGVLSEGELPGGSGITLGLGQSLDLGNAWIRTSAEDLTVRLIAPDGSLLTADILYVGGPVIDGDYSGNGQVGPEDWPLFRAGLGNVGEGMSRAQAYQLGDLDGDGDTDLLDFRAFRTIYDANNGAGALAALMTSQVPEPLTSLLAIGMVAGIIVVRGRTSFARRPRILSVVMLATLLGLASSTASAQVFTLTSPATPPTATANSEFAAAYVVTNLLDDATLTGADIGIKAYGGADAQYAGVGAGPMELFFDYGSSITTNYIAYAQRVGADPNADKVGTIDLWFSDSDFGGVIPAASPDAHVAVTSMTGLLAPYSLGGVKSGRFVAARLTISDVSLNSPQNNIGGNELRLVTGPSDVVLEVNRSNGNLTIRNQGTLAQDLQINGYEIRSNGSLLSSWAGFEDGSVAGFTPGTGTGNGWEKGASSNSQQLVEAFLLGSSTLATDAVLPLGIGYDTSFDGQDLEFYISTAVGAELLLPGRVVYVGGSTLLGDYNNDGSVDARDYVVWRNNLGATSLPNEDATASPGIVDGADYLVWKNNYGQSSPAALAGIATVPEPASLGLVALAGMLCLGRRLYRRGTRVACLIAMATGWATLAQAATPDAIYLFGDNLTDIENGAPGVEVGQGAGASVPGYTLDHYGDFNVITTFRDLVPVPDNPGQRPKYISTASLNYPGTNFGSSTSGVGIVFDGVDDALTGLALGFPADGDANFEGSYTNAYFNITTRLIDGWVHPTNLSGARQDIVNDSSRYGIHITENNTWGLTFAGGTFDSNLSVAGTLDPNGWAHVQHITSNNRARLLVNGEIALITPALPYIATPGEEIVFGANLTTDGNFFTGTLDNFRLSIAGSNLGLTPNGKDYGSINLLTDNDYITANAVPGDANGDGMVLGDGTGDESVDDVTYFVNRFFATQELTDIAGNTVVAGDLNSITTMADFDGSGRTDILDWIILYQNHQDAAALARVDLASLLGSSHNIPEPSSLACLLLGLGGFGAWRLLRRC